MIGSTLSADIVRVLYEEISGEEMSPVRRVLKARTKPMEKAPDYMILPTDALFTAETMQLSRKKASPLRRLFVYFLLR